MRMNGWTEGGIADVYPPTAGMLSISIDDRHNPIARLNSREGAMAGWYPA